MKRIIALIVVLAGLVFAASMPTFASADTGFTVTVSSTLADDRYESGNLIDGDPSTVWYSQWADEKNPACNEWILIDFGSVRKVESILLTPNPDKICFPSDFKIQWGITGDVWPEIEGFSFTDYQTGESSAESFQINTVTRYVRVSINGRNKNPDGNYLISLSEISATVRNATALEIENAEKADAEIERLPVVNDPVISSSATASSSNTPEKDWGVANVNDGLLSSQWCAEWGSGVNEEACEEWVVLAFASPQYVKGVIIESQLAEHYGFPKEFTLEWTLDGEHYFTVEGARYADESREDTRHVKVFSSPVVATAVRMSITASYPDSTGNYVPQMAEFQAHGRSASESEIMTATRLFNELLGNNTDNPIAKGDPLGKYGAIGECMLAFALAFFGAAAGIALHSAIKKQKGENPDEK